MMIIMKDLKQHVPTALQVYSFAVIQHSSTISMDFNLLLITKFEVTRCTTGSLRAIEWWCPCCLFTRVIRRQSQLATNPINNSIPKVIIWSLWNWSMILLPHFWKTNTKQRQSQLVLVFIMCSILFADTPAICLQFVGVMQCQNQLPLNPSNRVFMNLDYCFT